MLTTDLQTLKKHRIILAVFNLVLVLLLSGSVFLLIGCRGTFQPYESSQPHPCNQFYTTMKLIDGSKGIFKAQKSEPYISILTMAYNDCKTEIANQKKQIEIARKGKIRQQCFSLVFEKKLKKDEKKYDKFENCVKNWDKQ
jgi:hypothetical protein